MFLNSNKTSKYEKVCNKLSIKKCKINIDENIYNCKKVCLVNLEEFIIKNKTKNDNIFNIRENTSKNLKIIQFSVLIKNKNIFFLTKKRECFPFSGSTVAVTLYLYSYIDTFMKRRRLEVVFLNCEFDNLMPIYPEDLAGF